MSQLSKRIARGSRIAALGLALNFVAGASLGETSSAIGDGASSASPLAAVGAAPEANLFSGAMSTSVPIVTPPGRANATPSLSLSYSSASGDGPFGIGWSLPTGSITRSTKRGVPRCVGPYTNEYVLNIPGGSHELVPSGTTNIFLAKRDQAYFEAEADPATNQWTVRDRSGRTYTFGSATGAVTLGASVVPARVHTGVDTFMTWTAPPAPTLQDEKPFGTCNYTASWALNRITDPNGNVIDFTYLSDNGVLYPYEVAYGGNLADGASPNHPFRVRFVTEVRAFSMISYRSGVKEQLDRQVIQVAVEADPDDNNTYSAVRTYTLAYGGSTCAAAPKAAVLLCSVAVNAPDGSFLPTQTFEYSSDEFYHGGTGAEFTVARPGSTIELRKSDNDTDGYDVVRAPMDMNGDGFTDIVHADGSSTWRVYRGSAAGYGAAQNWSRGNTSVVPNNDIEKVTNIGAPTHTTKGVVDITGDGIPDYVHAAAAGSWNVYVGSCAMSGGLESCGFSSTATSWSGPGTYYRIHVAYSDGDENYEHRRLMDVNADGLPDLVSREYKGCDYTPNCSQTAVYQKYVYLNTGSGFALTNDFKFSVDGSFDDSISYVEEDATSRKTREDLLDFNGDGLPDRMLGNASQLSVRLNTGRGYFAPAIVLETNGYTRYVSVSEKSGNRYLKDGWIDVNADGYPDFVHATGIAVWVHYNLGGTALAFPVQWSPTAGGPSNITVIGRTTKRGNSRVDFIDWNGDGLLDHVDTDTLAGSNQWRIKIGRPVSGPWIRPNLMIRARNGIGGVTEVRYAASTTFDNSPADTPSTNTVQQLPLAMYVVTGIRQIDGLGCVPNVSGDPLYTSANSCAVRGHEIVQTLSYEGGKFDSPTREFRGFRKVTQVRGDDTTRIVTFSQGDFTPGQMLTDDRYAFGGYKVQSEMFTWETVPAAPSLASRTQVYLSEHRTTKYAILPTNSTLDINLVDRNEVPDFYGRVSLSCTAATTGAIACGSPPTAVPTFVTTTVWTNPSTGHARERPASVSAVFKLGGLTEIVRQQSFLYDGRTDALVTKGNVTSTRNHLDGTANDPETAHAYDVYGNMTQIVNPRGFMTTSSFFGSPFSLYSTTDTSPSTGGVAHSISRTMDIALGVETNVTDENGAVFVSQYDGLGRKICEAKPGDACPAGSGFFASVTYSYLYGNPSGTFEQKHTCTIARRNEPASASGYIESRTCYDGLGRERFSTTQRVIGAGNALSTVVLSHKEYDRGGRVRASRAPFVLAVGASVQDITYVSDTMGSAPTYGDFLVPNSSHTRVTYDLNGNNPDPLGRVRSTTTPDGRTITTTYQGIRTDTLDADSKLTRVETDPFGRELRKIAYLGSTDTSSVGMRFDYTYDGAGRLTSTMVGQNTGTLKTVKYDALGRKMEVVDPDAGSGDASVPGKWVYAYDQNNNLVWQNDPKAGQHVELCYDERDRLTRRLLFTNDAAYGGATPCTGTPPAGVTIESSYVYDDQTAGNQGKGRLTFTIDLAGSESLTYDARGRLTKSTRSVASGASAFSAVMEFTYDATDRVKTIKYPDGEIVTYNFHADGSIGSPASGTYAVASTQLGQAWVIDIDYDFLGRPTYIEDSNGAAETYGYFDHTQNFALNTIDVVDLASAAVLDLTYSYHPTLPKIGQITDNRTYGTANLSNTYAYGYDGLGRLTSADWNGSATAFDESFGYDGLGNITSKSGGTYTYDTDATPHPHQATAYGSLVTGLTYDHNGNRLTRTKGGTSECYAYNALDRLVQVKTATASTTTCSSPLKTIAYAYDYSGRRVLKVPSSGDGGPIRYFSQYFESQDGVVTKHYFLGSRHIASQTKTLVGYSELPPGFVVPRTPIPWQPLTALALVLLALLIGLDRRRTPWRVLAPIPGRAVALAAFLVLGAWPTQAAACGSTGDPAFGVQFYHVDHLGSTLAMTNADGNVFRQIRYTAYGDIRGRWDATSGTLPALESKRQEFSTYETEVETGLQYAHARYYDPSLALFLSHDNVAAYPSPYQYGGLDPTNHVDPDGNNPLVVLFWIGVVWSALVAIDVGLATGDWGAALKGFAIGVAASVATSFAVGLVGAGIEALSQAAITAEQASAWIGVAAAGVGLVQSARKGDVLNAYGSVLSLVGAGLGVSEANKAKAGALAFKAAKTQGKPVTNRNGIDVYGDVAAYDEAVAYLEATGRDFSETLGQLGAAGDVDVVADANLDGLQAYDPVTKTVYWDTDAGVLVQTPKGIAYQTPALGLGHEIMHAGGHWVGNALIRLPAPRYDNLEEWRVIRLWEVPAARVLGEGQRFNHGAAELLDGVRGLPVSI